MRTGLEWRPLSFSENVSDLEKIVKTLKTVRNNLFHGGKQDLAGWEDDHRTAELVTLGRQVLDELAEKARLTAYKPT